MEPQIQIRGLSKVYGSGPSAFKALHSVDLDVHGGEILMLLGPSGSGKTTLLSIMGAILEASAGSVRIRGTEIAGRREAELPKIRLENIGFIFQGFNLFPALNALQNVELAMELRGRKGSAARKRAQELLEQMGLAGKQKTYPRDMSGGEKQRVAIARALAGDPPIILADEPTASLDSTSGQIVIELLQSLAKKEGRAVVVVTHDPRVLSYAGRTIHIADGKIQDNPAPGH